MFNPIPLLKSDKKSRLAVLIVLILILIALGLAWPKSQSSNSISPSTNPASLGRDTIGSQLAIPISNLDIQTSAAFPSQINTYTIKPAPFELFGPKGSRLIAQSLGFTKNAESGINGDIIYYFELGKNLSIDRLRGTIIFSTPFESLKTGPIDKNRAIDAVSTFLRSLGLDPVLFGFNNPQIKALSIKTGSPRETALTNETSFLELTPKMQVGNRDLIASQPLYGWIGTNNQIVGLSFWFPNLNWQNPQKVNLISIDQAKTNLKNGQVLWQKNSANSGKIKVDSIELTYWADLSSLDFSKEAKLTPIYLFKGEDFKAAVKAVN